VGAVSAAPHGSPNELTITHATDEHGRWAKGHAQKQRNGHFAELVANGHSRTAVALQLGISTSTSARIVGAVQSVSAAA
jgi:hypothetical protein